jgi:hypothetical protein
MSAGQIRVAWFLATLLIVLCLLAPAALQAADEIERQDSFDPKRRPILEQLAAISAPYGTQISIRKRVGIIRAGAP